MDVSVKNPQLWRLSLGHLLGDACAGFMLPLLPLLAIKLDFSLGATGFILTVSSLTSSVLQPLWGIWTEKTPRINVLLVGLLVAIICISLIGWAPDYGTLLLLIAVGYLGIGVLHPRAITYAHSLGGQNENLVMSIFITAGALGFALGPLLSAFLVENWGLGATAFCLPLLLVVIPLMRNIDRRFLRTLARPRSIQKNQVRFTSWEIRILAILSLIAIVRATLMVGLDSFMPFIWTDEGHSLMVIGGVIALSSLIGSPLALYAGYLGDQRGERLVMNVSLIPCLVLLPLLLFSSGESAFILFILIHVLLQFSLSANTVIALRGVKKSRNMVSGLMAGFSFGIAGLMMPLIGMLGEDFGLTSALGFLMLPLFLGVIALFLIPAGLYARKPAAGS